MFAPGVPDLMVEFRSTSEELAAFCVSVYVLGFAAGPMFFAPLSEIYGRSIIYNITNVGFIGRIFHGLFFFCKNLEPTDISSHLQSSSSPAQKPLHSMPSSSSVSSVASSAPSPSPSEAAASPT